MRSLLLAVFLMRVAVAEGLQGVQEAASRFEAERRWEDAAAVYRSALEVAGEGEKFWLRMSLTEMAFHRGRYAETWKWLKEAEASLGGRPAVGADWARLLNARAALNLVEGKLSAAERDLAAADKASDTGPARAPTLHNLASLEAQLGRLASAEDHQRKALALWREEYGDRHEFVMRAWISLSSILALRGDWRGAERSLSRALAITETPGALSNYAIVLDQLKRGKEAKAIRGRIDVPVEPNGLVDVKAMPGERGGLRVVVR